MMAAMLFLKHSFSYARTVRSALAFFLFSTGILVAVPRGQYSYPDEKTIALKEMRDSIEDIRHGVNNHEVEIRILDEKLKNVDAIIENVRDQTCDSNNKHKDQLKRASVDFEARIASIEAVNKGLIADFRQFQTHTNGTNALLVQYDQKLAALQKMVDRQDQNIEHLRGAVASLMEALQGKPQAVLKQNNSRSRPEGDGDSCFSPQGSERSYTVKAGDSLEKIARSHQTTIQAIKMANRLTSDRIIVGKTLIIPEK